MPFDGCSWHEPHKAAWKTRTLLSQMISVLILTLDEEVNIKDCIESLPETWRKDVWILDSESSDNTCALANEYGAKTILRQFTNYADQRNFGLSQAFEHDWVLMIDADERVSPRLANEIDQSLSDVDEEVDMYRCRRKDMFMNKWLKHASGYPTYFPRLFRKGAVLVEREINEEYACRGKVVDLQEHLIHFPFSKGLKWWYERHVRYAAMEAKMLSQERNERKISVIDVLSSDPKIRRATLKQIAYRLPFRPNIVFFYLYIVRGGFLDGKSGLLYARMRKTYEVMIDTMTEGSAGGERS